MRSCIVPFVAVGAGLAIAASSARAQVMEPTGPTRLSFGVLAGITVPVGSSSDFQSTGWHIGGLVDYVVPNSPLDLRADLTYHSLSGKDFSVAGTTIHSSDLHLVDVTGDVVYMFRPAAGTATSATSNIVPYLLGGIGFYHTSGSASGSSGGSVSATSTNFGVNGGGGIMVKLSGFSTFAEARLHLLFGGGAVDSQGNKTSAKFFPISIGVKFGGN